MTGKNLGLFDAHSTFDHKINISHTTRMEVELSAWRMFLDPSCLQVPV
jgi:hypothetical protein